MMKLAPSKTAAACRTLSSWITSWIVLSRHAVCRVLARLTLRYVYLWVGVLTQFIVALQSAPRHNCSVVLHVEGG